MSYGLFWLSFILAAQAPAQSRRIYFLLPSGVAEHRALGDTPVTLKAGERIDLELEIRTLSVEDQNRFAGLVIDDYRYDTPRYFTDGRVPNVEFEVMVERNGSRTAMPFRASSQGGGVDLQYLQVHVAFEFGGDHDKIQAETVRLAELWSRKRIPDQEAADKLLALRRDLAPNPPGVYQVRAFYRPNVPGNWKGELASAPVAIIVKPD